MAVQCAGCGDPIVEKTLLNALDRFWHTSCLNCSSCGLRLDELGSSVFVRSNMLLCRQDYLKLFGVSGTCAKCRLQIPPDELVMRCQDKVYHVNCFCCAQCQTPLNPGDKVCFLNGSLFCEHEFPHLFSGPTKPTTIRLTPTATSPCTSIDSDTGRGLVMNEISGKINGIVSSPKSLNMNPQSCLDPQQQQQSISMGPNKQLMSFTQSDLIGTLSPHPSSPVMQFSSANPNIPIQDNQSLIASGFYVTEFEQAFNDSSNVMQSLTEKSVKSSPVLTGTSTETTSGRKKQKKVDSRRCPPLRVC